MKRCPPSFWRNDIFCDSAFEGHQEAACFLDNPRVGANSSAYFASATSPSRQ